jgi:Monoamine oxidase
MMSAFDYHPTNPERVLSAVAILQRKLSAFGNDLALESLRVQSMRNRYSLDLLTRFYNEQMLPHFPLEDERDELDDWIYCLDPTEIATHDRDAENGPLMDILLLLCDPHCNSEDNGRVKQPFILAGVAFEYYQHAEIGLVSYVTTNSSFRRMGIMKALHPLAIDALEELHRLSHYERFGREPVCNIKAILAETNTVDAGDASQEDIKQRHRSLFALGYRFVEFPYIQPPLGTNMKTFDDVMLLVYQERDDSKLWFPEWRVSSSILFDFVSDFAVSVFGYDNDSATFSLDLGFWTFQKWFMQTFSSAAISQKLPWCTITPKYKKMYYDIQEKFHSHRDDGSHKVVAVIGAGVAGLAASVKMAKNATFPLLVQLIEANDCIGGRVRTVLTKDKSGQYVNEKLAQRYEAFSPWAVPLGAEFVHGVGSPVNQLIEGHGWQAKETFDFSSDDPDCVQVFLNGKCYSFRSGLSQDKSTSLINEAKQIWANISDIGDDVLENEHLHIPDDMCLLQFVELQMKGRSYEDKATVTSLIDAIFAKTAGTSTMCFGMNEGSREELNWDYEDCNFRTNSCFAELIEYFRVEIDRINKSYEAGVCEVMIQVIMKSPIVRVDSELDSTTSGRNIILSGRDGNNYSAHKAIVAVPLAVLKSGMIEFSGIYSLPDDKIRAIEKINMFSGMKAHVLLRKGVDINDSLLLDRTDLFFCPGEIFSQVWLQRNDATCFVTGFVVAEDRERLLSLIHESGKDARYFFMSQLHRMFRDKEGNILFRETEPTCAAFDLYDWSDDIFVGGIYSSPSLGAGWRQLNSKETCRHDLKAPLHSTIYFAGEHTNTKVCATVQSALDSGVIAAKDVLQSFSKDSNLMTR